MTIATAPHVQPNAIHPNSRNAESALSETDKAIQRHQILSALWLHPSGLIRQELEDATGINGDSLRWRIRELFGRDRRYSQMIEVCGSGKTRSGCKAEKLVLSMAGKLALGEVP